MKSPRIFLVFLPFLVLSFGCQPQPSGQETAGEPADTDSVYLAQGRLIAGATFATLAGKLQAALREGGVPNAVGYCNLAAYPLVDSLSEVYGAEIRRTTLRPRNPENAPDPQEEAILQAYHQSDASGRTLSPKVVEYPDRYAFYAPIRVNDFCLQCHGKPGETLTLANQEYIRQFYPEDRATGYVEGALRGMWHISFTKKK